MNFERAKKFYETILDDPIQVMPHPEYKYGLLPGDMRNGVSGGIVEGNGFEPSTKGTLIYLNGGEDLSVALSKVEASGGKLIFPKSAIGANGFVAHFIDTEGNKIAFHSPK